MCRNGMGGRRNTGEVCGKTYISPLVIVIQKSRIKTRYVMV